MITQSEYDLLHYMVAIPFEVATPAAISAGIEVWTWLISEKLELEVAFMGELLAAWNDTIRHHKGIFSPTLKYISFMQPWLDADAVYSYQDPFLSPVSYSQTDKELIDRGMTTARRLLSPHALVVQMLFSRLQAARYRSPAVMFLLQQLVLRSARAYHSLRYGSTLAPTIVLMTVAVHIHWLVRFASLYYYLDSRL